MKAHTKIQTKIYTMEYTSPLGPMTMAGIETAEGSTALTGLWFQGQKYFGATLSPEYEAKMLAVFEDTKRWLELYFQGKVPDFTPPLAPEGTSFQKAVWEILLTIPYGQTVTYGQIAEKIARQQGLPHMSAQAVGGAVGHNPISIIVPCHRVVGTDGGLTGYAGGLDKKQWLLRLEEGVK